MEPTPRASPPPRVLVIMDDQWPRALLRAELIAAGYDAIGARSVAGALRQPAAHPERGPVRLVLVDRHVLGGEEHRLGKLLQKHHAPIALLIAPAGETVPPGHWRRVLHRPISIGEIVATVRAELPLSVRGEGSIG